MKDGQTNIQVAPGPGITRLEIDENPFKVKRDNIEGNIDTPLRYLQSKQSIDISKSFVLYSIEQMMIKLTVNAGTNTQHYVRGMIKFTENWYNLPSIDTGRGCTAYDPRDLGHKLMFMAPYIDNNFTLVNQLKNLKVKVQQAKEKFESDSGNRRSFDETKVIESNLPAAIMFKDFPIYYTSDGVPLFMNFSVNTVYDATSNQIRLYSTDLMDSLYKSIKIDIENVLEEIRNLKDAEGLAIAMAYDTPGPSDIL